MTKLWFKGLETEADNWHEISGKSLPGADGAAGDRGQLGRSSQLWCFLLQSKANMLSSVFCITSQISVFTT